MEKPLIDEVNRLMKEGWRPQGGIAALDTENAWYYFQAMIKDTESVGSL
jgi:hypothetical protein